MTYRKLFALTPERRGIAISGFAAALLSAACFVGSPVFAQQGAPNAPAAAPKPPARPRPPAAPAAKPNTPAPAAAAAAAPGAAPQAGVAPAEMPPLIYSPWIKFCGKGQDASAKEVCFTGKDARTEAGQPVVAAALIEPEGEPVKKLRITLPTGLMLQYGARIIIDKDPPITGPFFTCFANGCMVDFDATAELIGKLKKGQVLAIQAINVNANAFTFPLPLTDNAGPSFAKANEGPPTDPKMFEEQQKKLQEELQKRAEDARRKLEGK
jgi:invasion protein IalB